MTNDERTALVRLSAARFDSSFGARQELVMTVASHFHDTWREPKWDDETGRYTPRFKPTGSIDDDWCRDVLPQRRAERPECFRETQSGVELDIANLSFQELSPSWQAENFAQANSVVGDCIKQLAAGGSLRDPAFMTLASTNAHLRWINRNSWLHDDAKSPDPKVRENAEMLLLPFDELPRAEQIKDENSVLTGIVATETYLLNIGRGAADLPAPVAPSFHAGLTASLV